MCHELLAKLNSGDLVALEAKYHIRCLASLYNRARQSEESDEQRVSSTLIEGIVLAELVAYIEDARAANEYATIFKLADLVRMYCTRAEQLLGSCLNSRVNSTHLKNQILAHFPNLQAHNEGRDVILVFSEDVGSAMRKACELDADTEGMHLLRAANIIRRQILNPKALFNGTFDSQCQES